MNEYQRLQYHQALHCIERDDLAEADRDMLRNFTRDIADPEFAGEFDLNMVFFWRLLGEATIRRRDERQAEMQRLRRSKGGKTTAKRRAASNPYAWMDTIFAAAWERLDQGCPKRIGHETLLKAAWQVAGREHPRREELTEHRARAWLATRRIAMEKKSGYAVSDSPELRYERDKSD